MSNQSINGDKTNELTTNELTSHLVCDIADTGEYKVCAVKIEKVQEVS